MPETCLPIRTTGLRLHPALVLFLIGTALGGCSAGATAVGAEAPDVTSSTASMDDLRFVEGLPLFTRAVIESMVKNNFGRIPLCHGLELVGRGIDRIPQRFKNPAAFLSEHFPQLVPDYEKRFKDRAFLPTAYRKRISALITNLRAKYGIYGESRWTAEDAPSAETQLKLF